MRYMINVRVVAFMIIIIVWFPSLTVCGDSSNQKDLFVVKRANGIWMPNTILPDSAPAFLYKGHWYSYCEAGIIRLDGVTNKISVIPLPEIKSKFPLISGMAIVNNTLLLSMRRDDGIFIFNLDKQSFTGATKAAKGTGFGEAANVSIILDKYNQKIWMSSFKHLDAYDIKSGQWESLDPIFSDLGIGEPSSSHKIMPDGDIVWINAPYHHRSSGGLIQIDLKRNKKVVFRKELVGLLSAQDRLGNMSLLSSQNYLWVYFYIQNGYNFYIAVYDKKNKVWKSYNRDAIIPAIELLIKELPHAKWEGENFLIELLSRISNNLDIDHPYRLKHEQLKVLKLALDRLSAAYMKYNINPNYDNYGFYDYSIHNSKIYDMNNLLGQNNPIRKINIQQISFLHLIGTFARNVVLETNEGIALVDLEKNTIQYLKPLTKFNADRLDIWWPKDKKTAIIRRCLIDAESGEENYDFILLNFEGLTLDNIMNNDKYKEYEFKELPYDKIVMADKEIILQWDGLLIKPLKYVQR